MALPAGSDQLNAFVNALVDLFTRLKLQPPQDYEVVRGWLQIAPDPVRCILPVIQGMLVFLVSKNLPPPLTWQYFDQAVLSSIQTQGG